LKIEGERESLLEITQAVLRVVSPRANTPALGGIRITADDQGLEMAGSDLETFMTMRGESRVVQQGALVVPGRLFGEILRSLPGGKVVVEGYEGGARIECGRSEFTVSTYPVADFARPPSGDAAEVCRVEAGQLGRALRQVGRAASVDEGRPVLTGVLWTIDGPTLKVVATDSYRLAVAELVMKEGPAEGKAIIPNRALAEFGRHLIGEGEGQAEVWLGDRQAVLSAGRVRLITRQIEGDFPNWQRLLPENQPNRLEVDKDEFLAAVNRVALVAQTNTPVKFHLGPDVQLTASESGVAEAVEVVEGASYKGDALVVAFNPKFFVDGLEGVEGKQAVLELSEPTKPATLRGVDHPSFTYLVMPVRLPG
jgi:DNA polymerase III subunit beta